MKKNDFAIFLVYLFMFALALCVGIFAIRPLVMDYGNKLPIHYVALVVLALLAGVLLNSLLLELGHLLGARVGGYEVLSFVVLGLGFKTKEGKKHFGLHSFDGLTGETRVSPKDVEKASLGAYTFLPIVFFIAEVVVMMVLNSLASNWVKTDGANAWIQIFAITTISVGGMIYLYDIFPFRLDSMNDGYLLSLMTHAGNRIPYNYLLLREKIREEGGEVPEVPVFDDITDFTAYLNALTAYKKIGEGDFDQAVQILDKTIAQEHGVSASTRNDAVCIKLALLLASSKTSVGKKYYEELHDDVKKFISDLGTVPALRCYLLISSCIEESEAESNYALDKAGKLLKNTDEVFLDSEKALLQHDKDFVAKLHPSWKLYPLPWEEKKEEEDESNRGEKEDEEKK